MQCTHGSASLLFYDFAPPGIGWRLNNVVQRLRIAVHIAIHTNRTLILTGSFKRLDVKGVIWLEALRTAFPCVFAVTETGVGLRALLTHFDPVPLASLNALLTSNTSTPPKHVLLPAGLRLLSDRGPSPHASPMTFSACCGSAAAACRPQLLNMWHIRLVVLGSSLQCTCMLWRGSAWTVQQLLQCTCSAQWQTCNSCAT
mmetsp:Transcript_9412/g.18226  ORF Transcript_9412/g.18226 Transcript_9412/m.18226 type:complete len:200 (-) Transcript_9412:373-972(-)